MTWDWIATSLHSRQSTEPRPISGSDFNRCSCKPSKKPIKSVGDIYCRDYIYPIQEEFQIIIRCFVIFNAIERWIVPIISLIWLLIRVVVLRFRPPDINQQAICFHRFCNNVNVYTMFFCLSAILIISSMIPHLTEFSRAIYSPLHWSSVWSITSIRSIRENVCFVIAWRIVTDTIIISFKEP